VKRGAEVSALCLFFRIPYAAPMLLVLRFLLGFRAKFGQYKKNPQIFGFGTANAPRFADRRGKYTPLLLLAQGALQRQ
jgi:hypothetical protein